MVSQTLRIASILSILVNVESGRAALVTTDLLSPNKKDLEPMGAPRYLKVCLMSMICSVAVLAATNSEPYVAVSTVACFLENQSTSVLLTKWRHPVKDLPVANTDDQRERQNRSKLIYAW